MQRDHLHGRTSKTDAGPGTNDPNKTLVGLFEQVQNETGASSLVGAADAVRAVFSALLDAVDVTSARAFADSMPPSLRSGLQHAGDPDRQRRQPIGDAATLFQRIAGELQIDAAAAPKLVRDVAAAAWVWLPRVPLQNLRDALPSDELRHLLRAG